VGREQRRAAGEIDDDVAGGAGAVPAGAEFELRAGGRRGQRVVVDAQLERPETPLGARDGAPHHREVVPLWRLDRLGSGQQHRHVEVFGQAPTGLDGGGVAPVDQCHALALNRNRGRIRQRFRAGGEQGGHLGAGAPGIRRPSGGLADLGVGDPVPGTEFVRHLVEQRRLQGAGNRDRGAGAQRVAEPVEFAAAELIGSLHPAGAAAPDDIGIHRHRLLAGAGEHDTVGHQGTVGHTETLSARDRIGRG
jgi:hypothetical protein